MAVRADKARDLYRHPAESWRSGAWRRPPRWSSFGRARVGTATSLRRSWTRRADASSRPCNRRGPTEYAATSQMVAAYKRKLNSRKRLYGDVQSTEFGPTSGPVAPAQSADLVLFLRNIHIGWRAASSRKPLRTPSRLSSPAVSSASRNTAPTRWRAGRARRQRLRPGSLRQATGRRSGVRLRQGERDQRQSR